jgi:hypothetical protein
MQEMQQYNPLDLLDQTVKDDELKEQLIQFFDQGYTGKDLVILLSRGGPNIAKHGTRLMTLLREIDIKPTIVKVNDEFRLNP